MSKYYHLRVTLDTGEHQEFITAWQTKFTQFIYKSVYASELSKDKVHHLHGHIEYNSPPTKQQADAVSYFMKKRGLSGGQKYNHDTLREDPRKNELYVTKDLKVILWYNYTEEQQAEIIDATTIINTDKAKDPKQKLIDILKQKHKTLLKFTMNQLLEEIKRVYILDWDKMPPPQCKAYTEYITVKELDIYTKNPKYKESPLGDYKVLLVPPLANSWAKHCEEQFRDNQNPDELNWEE